MNSMHEFIQHEHLSMARTGSSDPEPPGASTDTLPLLELSIRRLEHLQHEFCRSFSSAVHAVDIS